MEKLNANTLSEVYGNGLRNVVKGNHVSIEKLLEDINDYDDSVRDIRVRQRIMLNSSTRGGAIVFENGKAFYRSNLDLPLKEITDIKWLVSEDGYVNPLGNDNTRVQVQIGQREEGIERSLVIDSMLVQADFEDEDGFKVAYKYIKDIRDNGPEAGISLS